MEVNFTLYLDDSGTSPSQQVALATVLVIPTAQVIRLGTEWENLCRKENFPAFHTSECMAKNHKTVFSDWTDEKQQRVFSRVRQISKKYGTFAVSYAIKKEDYEVGIPDDADQCSGACRSPVPG